MSQTSRHTREAGFTLLELTVGLGIVGLVALAILSMGDVAQKNQRAIDRHARIETALRRASSAIGDDLVAARAASIVLDTTADKNSRITFQTPIQTSGGSTTWGVRDLALGSDFASRGKVGWSLRYEVVTKVLSSGVTDRRLMRQFLDNAGVVQLEQSIARGLLDGDTPGPGLKITAPTAPAIAWSVEINASIDGSREKPRGVSFSGIPRN